MTYDTQHEAQEMADKLRVYNADGTIMIEAVNYIKNRLDDARTHGKLEAIELQLAKMKGEK